MDYLDEAVEWIKDFAEIYKMQGLRANPVNQFITFSEHHRLSYGSGKDKLFTNEYQKHMSHKLDYIVQKMNEYSEYAKAFQKSLIEANRTMYK